MPPQTTLRVRVRPKVQHVAAHAKRATRSDRRPGQLLVRTAAQAEAEQTLRRLGTGVVDEVLAHAERLIDGPLLPAVAPPRRTGRHLQHEVRRLALVRYHVGQPVPLRHAERHQHVRREAWIDGLAPLVQPRLRTVRRQVVHEDVPRHRHVVAVGVAVLEGAVGVVDPPELLVAIRHRLAVRLRQVLLVQIEQRQQRVARCGFRHGSAPMSVLAVCDVRVPHGGLRRPLAGRSSSTRYARNRSTACVEANASAAGSFRVMSR